MTTYKRNPLFAKGRFVSRRSFSGPTPVSLHWSQKYGAYSLKWANIHHFDEMGPIMSYLKGLPYGDYEYDPDNKIWYFNEKYLQQVRTLLDSFGPTIFITDFQEKPSQQTNFSKFVPVEQYLNDFKNLTGEDIHNLEYDKAKKIYRRVCMKFHPDRNPGDANIAAMMSSVNEIWTELETKHFKVRKEIDYANVE